MWLLILIQKVSFNCGIATVFDCMHRRNQILNIWTKWKWINIIKSSMNSIESNKIEYVKFKLMKSHHEHHLNDDQFVIYLSSENSVRHSFRILFASSLAEEEEVKNWSKNRLKRNFLATHSVYVLRVFYILLEKKKNVAMMWFLPKMKINRFWSKWRKV